MTRTDREELIFQIADRAMNSNDPHEYVRAISAIHCYLTEESGYRIPQCYADVLVALCSVAPAMEQPL